MTASAISVDTGPSAEELAAFEQERPARRLPPAPDKRTYLLTFDQPDFTGPGALAGLFGREFHPLSFPQELEDRSAHGAAMKEVLDTAFVADEPEPLVDKKSSDRPGWHSPCPPMCPYDGARENIPQAPDAELERAPV